MTDENGLLAVKDTAFEVYFGKTLITSLLERVYITGNPQIEKSSSTVNPNRAKLIFKPGKLEDGEYTLRVMASDYKGNLSGKDFYEITFRVINENAVSQILNYPNPFSSCTHFVYTITGGSIPDIFKIYIYTITGKLVKVIDLLQEGGIYYGKNISDYCWDGLDEYGDQLANGVYLYRPEVKFGKRNAKLYDEGVSEFFDQGYGKMYLFR